MSVHGYSSMHVGQTITLKTIRQNTLQYINIFKKLCQRTVHVYNLIKVRKDSRHFFRHHDIPLLQWTIKHGLQYGQHTNMCMLGCKQL